MVDTCVCCGAIIPEGRMICWSCEYQFDVVNATPCPECGGKLTTMCVIGADQSNSGFTERWKNCDNCTSDWETYYDEGTGKEVIKRHFWG